MNVDYLCYTDGSTKAGDGAPGGWGFCIKTPSGERLEGWGKARDTLSKVMECQAIAEALAVLPEKVSVVVFADDQALVENLTKNLKTWSQRGFAKVDPLLVSNLQRICATVERKQLTVRWQWLRSHNGNDGNERADELAAKGAREAKAEIAAEAKLLRRGGG